jgi:proteasome lid subunit RPN8/RPN11
MPPFTRLTISDLLLEEVIRHARASRPNECCGLLAGNIVGGVGVVTARFAIGNDAASTSEYETNARDMFNAFRAMRDRRIELLAIYHSHPASEPIPSRHDIERNTYGECVVHPIVGFANAEPKVRAWWLTETGYREAEWEVVTISDQQS